MSKKQYPPSYNIGLALSGGSAKGFAHLGVLKYLQEKHIQPEILAGTSIGALMAALYCDGYDPVEIIDLFSGQDFRKMTNWQLPKGGLFDTTAFRSFLRSILRHERLEDLPLPLHIVATDLDSGRSKYFEEGPLVEIITASCSIPVLFNPVEINGTYYVDGGLFKNLPASVIRPYCRVLIGVHLDPEESPDYKKNILSIAERSFSYIFRANSLPDRQLCDVLVESNRLQRVRRFDIDNAPRIAKLGYDMATKAFTKVDLEELLLASLNQHRILSASE